jgi:hypothetical protein
MKSNDVDITAARIKLTATGALDHDAIQARAQQLRRETLSALSKALVRRVMHAWTVMTRRRSLSTCTHGHSTAGNCADH